MAGTDPATFRDRTVAYYRDRFAEHGATPRGVDWNGSDSQDLNFAQLLRVADGDDPAHPININDWGCGYGALADYLLARRPVGRYRGCDVNEAMVAAARARHADPAIAFAVADRPLETADYGVASGIFTLRLGRDEEACWAALLDGAATLHRTSRRGFALNCLTSYSDRERMRDELFYPDPCRLFDHCKRHFSRQVALLHDYGLYAFTIIVRHDGARP